MREILFRGKRVENGDWFEGHLVRLAGMYFIFSDKGHECHAVVKNTIGQFTGMVDKNGEKIFEGDVITYTVTSDMGGYPYCERRTSLVRYNYCVFMPLHRCDEDSVEVIGNIHDNPELLEVKK